MTVTLGISTVGPNSIGKIENFIIKNKDQLKKADEVIFVVQFPDKSRESYFELNERFNLEVKYIFKDEKGISRSRNTIIKLSTCEYIWFLDDDINILSNSIEQLKNIRTNDIDVICGKIVCKNIDGYYQNYPSARLLKRIDLFRVSSVSIIVRREYLLKKQIYFDETIGLGTDIPSGEEVCFLFDIFESGGKIKQCDIDLCKHDCSGRGVESKANPNHDWSNPKYIYSKGVIASNVGGFLGSTILLRWILRILVSKLQNKLIYEIIKGYVRYDK